ncbi:unnamed protein product [Caenorhabditis angaria]|uniref:Ferrochelatase n=1 Tax=Caenorhabditis angaria TaxID=860376 RepID=A0A9P1MUD6_9PELO|nr:unnamed protein product [Caenorhabditis angaria]
MVARTILAASKNALKNSGTQTEVVLLHIGQPWTDFYAKEFLLQRSLSYYNLPGFAKCLIPSQILTNSRISDCISEYGKVPSIEQQIQKLSENLETSLSTLVPEFGPFKVSQIFKFGQKNLDEKFDEIKKKNRPNRFIFLPLYPHFYGAESGQLLTEIAENIRKSSISSVENSSNREIQKSRIEQNSDYSYDVSAIHRWAEHPILAEYWASKIREEASKLDGIVFAVPRKFGYDPQSFDRAVWSTCDRVSSQLLSNSLPYRIGYYNSWDSWNRPIFGIRSSAQKSVRQQRNAFGEQARIGIVPITEVLQTFDTLTILPKLVEELAPKTHLFHPDPSHPRLAQGLSELLKSHLLGRPNRQLEIVANQSIFWRKNDEALRIFYQ